MSSCLVRIPGHHPHAPRTDMTTTRPLARLALGALPFALLALGAGAAAAQETIATDRPGLGFSALTVPAGALQVELGLPAIALDGDGGADARLVNFPGLVRYGVTESLELRLGSTLFNSFTVESGGARETAEGFGAVELGAKYAFSAGGGGPALALIPSVVVPVDEDWSGDRVAYALNGVAAWSLPAGVGLTTVAGVAAIPEGEDDHRASYALAAVLGRSLAERVGGFVEGGWYPTAGAGDAGYAGGGATYLLTDVVQVDAFVGRGLTDASTDWLLGVGAAVRL